jgi:hypothetical protein
MNKEQYVRAITNARLKKGYHIQKDMPSKDGIETRLYTITTLEPDTRCVAVCKYFNRAIEIVENNECDICEGGSNGLVVIEPIVDGMICEYLDEQYWYVLTGDWKAHTEKYVPIEMPEECVGVCGWGVG